MDCILVFHFLCTCFAPTCERAFPRTVLTWRFPITGCSSGQCVDEKWMVVNTWMITIRPIIPRINRTILNFMTGNMSHHRFHFLSFVLPAILHNGLGSTSHLIGPFLVRDVLAWSSCSTPVLLLDWILLRDNGSRKWMSKKKP